MSKHRAAFTLLESLMALQLLLIMSVVTTLLFRNVSATIQFATSRMDSTRLLRNTVSRLAPLLQTAYVPALSGATLPYEAPLTPYPAGVSATDPLAPQGPGVNSYLFYSPLDLIDATSELMPPDIQTTHLYELRLLESLDIDRTAFGGVPLQLRTLVLQERRPPVKSGVGPFPLLAGRNKVVIRGLSDLRITRISGIGVNVRAEAQARQKTLSTSGGQSVVTTRLEAKIYFPVLSQ